jgi:hypothetical protein
LDHLLLIQQLPVTASYDFHYSKGPYNWTLSIYASKTCELKFRTLKELKTQKKLFNKLLSFVWTFFTLQFSLIFTPSERVSAYTRVNGGKLFCFFVGNTFPTFFFHSLAGFLLRQKNIFFFDQTFFYFTPFCPFNPLFFPAWLKPNEGNSNRDFLLQFTNSNMLSFFFAVNCNNYVLLNKSKLLIIFRLGGSPV